VKIGGAGKLRVRAGSHGIVATRINKEMSMTIRLIALCLCLLPTTTLAQQSSRPGECDYARACPSGQIMDNATKTCVEVSA
jgi:hypothetical protein